MVKFITTYERIQNIERKMRELLRYLEKAEKSTSISKNQYANKKLKVVLDKVKDIQEEQDFVLGWYKSELDSNYYNY